MTAFEPDLGGSSVPGGSSTWRRAPRHGLPPRHFDALARGEGGATVIAHLWDAERSHRLVLLGLLSSSAADTPLATGPLPSLDDAWHLLTSADRRSSAVTDDLLLMPQIGQWLQHTLRRLRTHQQSVSGRPPLWADVGQLHVMAAAAAVRTGLPFQTKLPAGSGAMWLPSLGYASLPGSRPAWEAVDTSFDGRTLVIGHGGDSLRLTVPLDEATRDWQPLCTLRVDVPDGPSRVVLGHAGPYRILPESFSGHPRESSTDSVEHWTRTLEQAWQVLSRADPQAAEDVAACLRSIEPLPPSRIFRWYSATTGDGMGGLAVSEPSASEPAAAAQFAAILSHEVQHSKLSALLHMYALHEPEDAPRLYAPWQDRPRPLRGILHGVYAFTAVARFWRGHVLHGGAPAGEHALAAFEYALRRNQLLRVLPQLRQDGALTALGRRVVEQLSETVEAMEAEVAPTHLTEQAERAVDDHAVSWRLHHLAPDAGVVTALAREWRDRVARAEPDGEVAPSWEYPRPRLVPNQSARDLDARTVLVRVRLAGNVTGQQDFSADGSGLVLGVTPADFQLLDGHVSIAQAMYAMEIVEDQRRGPGVRDAGRTARAWAGLRLALQPQRAQRAPAQALMAFPELVRDVYETIGAVRGQPADPVAVAAWVGRTVVAPASRAGGLAVT